MKEYEKCLQHFPTLPIVLGEIHVVITSCRGILKQGIHKSFTHW
jgi:hypothetical protein